MSTVKFMVVSAGRDNDSRAMFPSIMMFAEVASTGRDHDTRAPFPSTVTFPTVVKLGKLTVVSRELLAMVIEFRVVKMSSRVFTEETHKLSHRIFE